jgi:hypothetical protein
MANLELIQRMLKTTKNFWQVLFLKFNHKKRKINFRNGATLELDLVGYRNFRDLFYTLNLKKFKVTKNSEEFVISKIQPFSVVWFLRLKHYSYLTSLFLSQIKTGTYVKLTRKPSKLTENRYLLN